MNMWAAAQQNVSLQYPLRQSPRRYILGRLSLVATSGQLPLTSAWRAGHKLQKGIRRAANERATFQLFVDLPAIAQQGIAAEKTAFKVLQHIAALRRRGIIEVETVAAAAHRLSEGPAATPQRSILRIAA